MAKKQAPRKLTMIETCAAGLNQAQHDALERIISRSPKGKQTWIQTRRGLTRATCAKLEQAGCAAMRHRTPAGTLIDEVKVTAKGRKVAAVGFSRSRKW